MALFWMLSAAFFWQPLFQGGILVPTQPRGLLPWSLAEPPAEAEEWVSNPLMNDVLTLTCPWRLYNHQVFRRGEIPFWNPRIFAGYPHLAALQSNALYPPTLLFDLWDPIAGIGYAMAIHLALAGSLMFVFLRRIGLRYTAALLGGVVFELNGFFLVRMSAPSYVFSGIWTPLFLLGIHDVLRRDGWRSSWKIALAVCGAVLGGHPQILALMLLIGLGYAGFVALTPPGSGLAVRLRVRRFLMLGGAVALGLGLSGVQLLPFLELVRETVRSPVELASYRRLALPAPALMQAAVPDFFGHPVDEDYWLGEVEKMLGRALDAERAWGWNYSGENLFTGTAPLVLALFALARLRRREALYFGTLAALALLVLLGSPLVARAFYELVPTFQHSRADRVIYVYMFAVSVLAALGWEAAARGGGEGMGRRVLWTARMLIALVPVAVVVQMVSHPDGLEGYRRFLALAREKIGENLPTLTPQILEGATAALVALAVLVVLRRVGGRSRHLLRIVTLLVVTVPLFRFGWRFNPVQTAPLFPSDPVIGKLRAETGGFNRIVRLNTAFALPNTAQIFDLFDVNGSSAAALANYARLISEADPEAIRKDKYFKSFRARELSSSGLLDFLNAELIVSGHGLELPEIPVPRGAGFRVFRNPDVLPRFFLVDEVVAYEDPQEGVRMFLDPSFRPGRTALVRAADRLELPRSATPPGAGGEAVEILAYGAHEIALEVRADATRLLVSSEVDYPGWEVDVDAVRQKLILVNTAFRGVVVPAGTHRVVFHYVPRSFYLGAALSVASGAALFLGLFAVRRRQGGAP